MGQSYSPRYKGLSIIIDWITTGKFLFSWDWLLPADRHVFLSTYKLNKTGKLLTFYIDSF